ncbi:MAG: sigma-70 family RNA polymerase sigma factor [Ruminococcus sp.]|nr:sigma-70 family RNA polymerase sigma factor [Ruminococcus sp.]
MNAEEVVRTYSDMIYGVAMRYVLNRADADDVYSDVFYRYFRRERSFDSEEHRKAWLLRVTVNCSKDLVMNRRYGEEINDDMFGSQELSGSDGVSTEEIMDVRNAVKKLGNDQREVIELFYFNGLSVKEISQMLQRPENTVKSQLMRARGELKKQLAQ